nr:uncharacterized protein LOC117218673 [Megalopta genalis]
MDTSTCSFVSQSAAQSSAQRKFYQWVLRWINGVPPSDTESYGNTRLDLPILAGFLQGIGFKLLLMDKTNDSERKNGENNLTCQPGILKVAIECGSSKMKAVLELDNVTCRCPHSDHVNDASFWSVSGTGPSGSTDNIARKVVETGSNLLPRLPKDVTQILRDVSQRLFDTISYEPDVNRNTEVSLNIPCSNNISLETTVSNGNLREEIGVSRSNTAPEIYLYGSNGPPKNSVDQNASPPLSKPVLQRQRTWDIETENVEEPRSSLPTIITSSPTVPHDLSQSLGQLSLPGEEDSKNLTEYIIGAKAELDKALKMLARKSFVLNDASLNQDDTSSVKSAPAKISQVPSITPLKKARMSAVSSVKPLSSLSRFTKETQALVRPAPRNVLLTPRSPRTQRISDPIPPSATKRSIQMEQENAKSQYRRRSFYLPSSHIGLSLPSKPIDIGQKYNTNKLTLAAEPNSLNRPRTIPKSPSKTRIATPKKFGALSTPTGRTSMLKQPTKVLQATKSVIAKPVTLPENLKRSNAKE